MMLRRLYPFVFALALLFLASAKLQAQDYVYTDATSLPVFGKIRPDTFEPFSRLPKDLETVSRPAIWRLGRNSAGEYVRFSSDAGAFSLKWTSTFNQKSTNMSACVVNGLALYVLDGGEWIYVGTGRPNGKDEENISKIACSKLKGQMHEYLLYLSLYDGVKTLEIGVPEGCTVAQPKVNSPRCEKPVIMYGTSILQGASASHPGMSGTNQLTRLLNRQVINLGFSGNALLDMEIAELMASYPDPGVYVLDNMPNGTPELTLEKEAAFFRILRKAHPDVPVVFVENPNYPGMRFDAGRDNYVRVRNEALHKVYEQLLSEGEKDIYLVGGMKMLGEDNVGTIEGTHFTDIGFTTYANTLAPVLKPLLDRYLPSTKAAEALAARIFPNLSAKIDFSLQEAESDFYSLETKDGRLRICGNNVNSLATGFGEYLREYCKITPTWFSRDAVKEPETLPEVHPGIRRKAIVGKRFFLNYCTYGYTLGWWQWDQWERLIDWMAMNGVTLALANTGQESVWQKVWMRFGLSEEQTRAYFPGPSFLSWHRMTNMDAWHGPLPQHWLDSQQALQKKIITRETELGISPILSAFTGHVPKMLKDLYPQSDIRKLNAWGGFAEEYNPWYLNPNDPLFSEVQKVYLEEQRKMYGQCTHVYGIDLFNEVNPPSWDEEYLKEAARKTYESLIASDPDAVWLQMSWLFWHKRKSWTPSRIKAYISPIPAHRLIMLDYYCDKIELYRNTENFHGQDFIWSYLGNFGGNTMMAGNIADISAKISDVAGKVPNCVGLGCTLEGLDVNPMVYEYVLGRAWESDKDDADWFRALADRRLEREDADYRKTWEILSQKVYKHLGGHIVSMIPHRPNLAGKSQWNQPQESYDNRDLLEAWGHLAKVKDSGSPSLRFDYVNIPRQWLDNHFTELYQQLLKAYSAKDRKQVRRLGREMLEILDDVDRLVAADAYFLLGRWIEEARSWGNTPEMKDYLEWDAKDLLSCWGYKGGHLTDYANRDWNGLISTYYKPRWAHFIQSLEASLSQGTDFDEAGFKAWCNDFEWNWIGEKNTYQSQPSGSAATQCRQLYRKYNAR